MQLAAPRWQKYPRAAFALLTRAHTHTRTDSGACPVPADRWNRRSDASTPPAALMDAPVTGAVSARSDRSAVDKWNLGIHVIGSSASPEQQQRTNARAPSSPSLSLALCPSHVIAQGTSWCSHNRAGLVSFHDQASRVSTGATAASTTVSICAFHLQASLNYGFV